MSQQEFFQESQSQQEGQQPFADNEIADTAQPYYWSTRPPQQGAPKEAPTEGYDEPMVHNDYRDDYQHGYLAQDTSKYTYAQAGRPGIDGPRAQPQASSSQKQQFSPDGDSFERQYRPYARSNIQWNVPYWARPQRQPRGSARVIWLIILGVIFIGPALHILGTLLAVAGVILLTLLFPFLVFALFAIPYTLYRISRRRSFFQNRWRGSWW
ncbi:MAG TPA: hypothetical protein VFK47_07120 [Ktedonobacteraceae bacterium]|nr:hypothetical protein [Ktedonobacteraceae bacterium]